MKQLQPCLPLRSNLVAMSFQAGAVLRLPVPVVQRMWVASTVNVGSVDCSSAERGSVWWFLPTERIGKVRLIFNVSSCRCCRIFLSFLKVSILEQVSLL